ncbi:hypothetical protein [uncultured Cytophaga sp.]|mgnify:FL=1|uniref:hypothetical protein n=1 Tax=uncultured Cytophaga sp. TaxID=160238 RepID=UPI002636C4BE|nr:hypothetical protein [uncultured Cytophaga sp.]
MYELVGGNQELEHMRTKYYVIFLIILSSCTSISEKNKTIINTISDVYSSTNVEITEGFSTGDVGGTHPYIEVSLAESKYINEDSTYDIQNAGTSIALIVYENLENSEIKEDLTIEVIINQNFSGNNRTFSFKFPVELVKNAFQCFETIDSTYKTIMAQNYSATYAFLDKSTKDTLSSNIFVNNFIVADSLYGKINNYKIKGFEFLPRENNRTKRDLIKFKTTGYRESLKQRIEFYFNSEGDKQKAILID